MRKAARAAFLRPDGCWGEAGAGEGNLPNRPFVYIFQIFQWMMTIFIPIIMTRIFIDWSRLLPREIFKISSVHAKTQSEGVRKTRGYSECAIG